MPRRCGQMAITLTGRLDALSAPSLTASFDESAEDTDFSGVKIDAAVLEYVSSNIVIIAHAGRTANGRVAE